MDSKKNKKAAQHRSLRSIPMPAARPEASQHLSMYPSLRRNERR